MKGCIGNCRRLAVISTHDPSFEFAALRSIECHLFPSSIQTNVQVFPFRTCKILDLIQDWGFVVYAIGLLVRAKRKVDVKVVNSWVARRAQGRFAQDPPNSGNSARLVRRR